MSLQQMDISCDNESSDTAARAIAKKALTSSNHLINGPIPEVHGVNKSSRCKEILGGGKDPKLNCKELSTTEEETSLVQRRLSDGANYCFANTADAKRKSLRKEDRKKPPKDTSRKPVIIHASGVKIAVRPHNLDGSYKVESYSDVNTRRGEEVNIKYVGEETLQVETMRKRFAAYIGYSGSESSVSDSETLDSNHQEKDCFQLNKNILNTDLDCHRLIKENDEMDSKCENNLCSGGIVEELDHKIVKYSKLEKENSEEIEKFSEKYNVTERNADHINSLTPAQGKFDDASMNNTAYTRSFAQGPIRCTLKKVGSDSRGGKLQEEIKSGRICEKDGDMRDTLYIQNERKALSFNDSGNRCLEDKRIVQKHDMLRYNSGIHCENPNEIDLKLLDECSGEVNEWQTRSSREPEGSVGNNTSSGHKEREKQNIDSKTGEDHRETSRPGKDQSVNHVKSNKLRSDTTYFTERPLRDYKSRSRDRSRSPRYRYLEDPDSSCNSDTSPVTSRSPKGKHSVLRANQERMSDDGENKQLAKKKDSFESKIDEPTTFQNNTKHDSKHQSHESTSLERVSKYAKSPVKKDLENDNKVKNSSQRRNHSSRRSVSIERERQSPERTSLERESKHATKSQDSSSRYSRRSVSIERERQSPERTSLDRESKYATKSQDSSSRYSRRSVSIERERRSREWTSLERESNYSKPQDSSSRYSRRSVSIERERHSRERTSLERESKYAKPQDSSSRYSRRSVSIERERWSRERTSLERECNYARSESRKRENGPRYGRFRSTVVGRNGNRQEQSRRLISDDGHDYSWVNNIVVKIAEPRRGPIRKGRTPNKHFIYRSRMERSSEVTDERRLPKPSTKEDRTENEVVSEKRKKRWTYDDYIKQNDGTLRRIRQFSEEEEDHSEWKRYDDERTMPYQGYADSQVHSLLKQLCRDYVIKLYSKGKNVEDHKPLRNSQNAVESGQDVKDHRTWFMTSSEWISYGIKAARPEVSNSADYSVTCKDSSTEGISLVWHTVPLLKRAEKEKIDNNNCSNNTEGAANNIEADNKSTLGGSRDKTDTDAILTQLESKTRGDKAKTDKQLLCEKENKMEPIAFQEELSTSDETMTEPFILGNTDILENQSHNAKLKQNKTASLDMSEERKTGSSSSDKRRVCSGGFAPGSSALTDFWNIPTSGNDASAQIVAKNDFMVRVTPSSYWYEKDSLLKQEEKASKADNKVVCQQSVNTPTFFPTSRPTNVLSNSICFHLDTSRFDLSPPCINYSDMDGNTVKCDPLVDDNTKTPQSENNSSKMECSINNRAKRQLNFEDVTEAPVSENSKNSNNEADENTIEMIANDHENKALDSTTSCTQGEFVLRTSKSSTVQSEDNISKLSMHVSDNQSAKQTVEYFSFSETDPKPVYLQITDSSTANEDAFEGNVGTNDKYSKCSSEIKSFPLKRKTKNHFDEGDDAEKGVYSAHVSHFSRKKMLPKELEKKAKTSSMSKVEDSNCKVDKEIWDLALMPTSIQTTGKTEVKRRKIGCTSGDVDVAVVKPSSRQKSPMNQKSETLTIDKTQKVDFDPSKSLFQDEQKNVFAPQKKMKKILETSKNPQNLALRFPPPPTEIPLVPFTSGPSEVTRNLLGRTKKGALIPVVSKRVDEKSSKEKSAVNLQNASAWSEPQQYDSQGSPTRNVTAPKYPHVKYGYALQSPNLQPTNRCYMVQSSLFSNQMVVQHHMINNENEYPNLNTPINPNVMATLPNHIETLSDGQHVGNQNPQVLAYDPPQLVDQQQAVITDEPFRSFNDSLQGLLLGPQTTSMSPQSNSFVGQGINSVHAFRSRNYLEVNSALPNEVEAPEYQQQIQQPQQIQPPQQIQQPHQIQPPQHIQQPQQIQPPHQIQQPHQIQPPQQIQPPHQIRQPQHIPQPQQIQPIIQQPQQQIPQQIQPQQIRQQIQPQIQQQIQQQKQPPQQIQQPMVQISQQQMEHKSQHQLQQSSQQRAILDLDGLPLPQQQTSSQQPQCYTLPAESPQLENWHDNFLNLPKNQDDLSRIPWGQHVLDRSHHGDLRMFPQQPQIRTHTTQVPQNAPQNAPSWYFNT